MATTLASAGLSTPCATSKHQNPETTHLPYARLALFLCSGGSPPPPSPPAPCSTKSLSTVAARCLNQSPPSLTIPLPCSSPSTTPLTPPPPPSLRPCSPQAPSLSPLSPPHHLHRLLHHFHHCTTGVRVAMALTRCSRSSLSPYSATCLCRTATRSSIATFGFAPSSSPSPLCRLLQQ